MAKYADNPTVEVWVDVDAAPAAVWALVTDINVPARFSEEFQAAEWIEGSGPGLGSRFRGTNRHPIAGEWTTESTIVEYDDEKVHWRGPSVTRTESPPRGGSRWSRFATAPV